MPPSTCLPASYRRALVAASLAFVMPGLLVLACSTDNGDTTHGPDIGKLPQRDANVPDGKILLPDGAIVDDPDATDPEGGSTAHCLNGTAPDGTIAVLAGDDVALKGAVQSQGGAWIATPVARGAAKSKPALVAFGAGFLGVTQGEGDALQWTIFRSCWTSATNFGTAGVKGAPSIAVAGTSAHVVYSAGPGADREYHHGIHDGNAWNAATANVGDKAAMPPTHSFGTISAGLAAVGAEVVFAENGKDDGDQGGGLYVRSFNGGTWTNASPVSGIGTIGNTLPAAPQLVKLDGAFELLLVYVQKDTRRLSWATRTSNAWTNKGPIHVDLNAAETFSLARIGDASVLLALRGQDGNGYYVKGTVGADTITWANASPIGGGAPVAVDSAPAVARGVGGDDAIVAYASNGSVSVTRLRGTTWTSPEALPSMNGSRVAIATK
jgi:hypothetical protein